MGWRPDGVRFGVFGRRCDVVEMVEDAPDDGGVFDAGDDLEVSATSLGTTSVMPTFVRW